MKTARLIKYLNDNLEDMLDGVRELVEIESPSRDKESLDLLREAISLRFSDLDLNQEVIPNADGGDHLRMTCPGPSDAPPALILCHFDTVWPLGTLATMPFRIEAGRAHGPGVYDMKSSLILVEFALRALKDLDLKPARPLTLLFTSDEEIGSPDSRQWIEREAKRSHHALVLEPPLSGGRLKTSRKGVGRFNLEVTGRSAHAGVEPEKGVNAIVEMARQILEIEAIADSERGTTLNVGTIQGGTTTNVVPASASIAIDVRVKTLDEAKRVEDALRSLQPFHPQASLAVTGGFNRPPMERTPGGIQLFERVREVGGLLGLDLDEGSTGGGSDGNFTSAVGTPTIDGLGMEGAGAHAVDEHILFESFPDRAALLALLLLRL